MGTGTDNVDDIYGIDYTKASLNIGRNLSYKFIKVTSASVTLANGTMPASLSDWTVTDLTTVTTANNKCYLYNITGKVPVRGFTVRFYFFQLQSLVPMAYSDVRRIRGYFILSNRARRAGMYTKFIIFYSFACWGICRQYPVF
jgi:hypothetical protein